MNKDKTAREIDAEIRQQFVKVAGNIPCEIYITGEFCDKDVEELYQVYLLGYKQGYYDAW